MVTLEKLPQHQDVRRLQNARRAEKDHERNDKTARTKAGRKEARAERQQNNHKESNKAKTKDLTSLL
jgi:hypothetical protein